MESVNLDVSLWQSGLVLLIFLLIALFIGSLKLGNKFMERQQARRERKLQNFCAKIASANALQAQIRLAKTNAEKPVVKKPLR
jgi:hypothetical protein